MTMLATKGKLELFILARQHFFWPKMEHDVKEYVKCYFNVDCEKHSIKVTWKVSPELVENAARLFLGHCVPSTFSVLPTGEGMATFHYNLNGCAIKKRVTGKKHIYSTNLTYRPNRKPKPAAISHHIKCVYIRPEGWIPPFLIPAYGSAEGHGGLVFHMALLNEDLTGLAKTSLFPLGSFIPIWAAVDQKDHQPLLLLLEECVAATTPELQSASLVYPIITNKGCLADGKTGNSRFLPRYHSSAILLYLQSFKFALGEEVYIHCKLVAWDPEVFDIEKKACHYIKETGEWELLDDPSQSDLCKCCDSSCKPRLKRGVDSEPQGLVQNSVLGPLTIVENSETQIPNFNVDCEKHSIKVTWKVSPELVENAARLFLGHCVPSTFSVLPTGEGMATFHYNLNGCAIKKRVTGKKHIYSTNLTYRPNRKPKPAAISHHIKCVYIRPEGWIPPFLIPAYGSAEGHGGLVFHMALLNEDLTGLAKTSLFPLGSFIPIWAAVDQKDHQPLLLLLEECVAATTPELQSASLVYPIITNKGCLADGKTGNSRFLPRYHSSAILLYLQSFKFALGEEVYIHCKLVAWDPEVFDIEKKACHYIKETGEWELLDDPSQSDLCKCCDSSCKPRLKRGVDSEPQGLVQNSVLGPLTIVENSETQIPTI
ncbi:uncharacterized protein LOC120055372 [Salvelinus namaycush]|uniref:Uncharacterized protein LOC120055372 n=1 Tax=Salvelinus namaycush TaxID=8040 RepID=A0A8U1EMW1_SALNM|nr:uncharacterized protein LOC120055372 [Salvelinus namaycush]